MKSTAASDSAELVAGHQSQQKRPHALPDISDYLMLSVEVRYEPSGEIKTRDTV
ncbi:MAG: hypothetical protein GQ555_05835 [Desulfobacterales bacterium]|nr:hypothetical protein [Desulfobacterales bacterium]